MNQTRMHALLGLYLGFSIAGAWLVVVKHDPGMISAGAAEQLMLAGWLGVWAAINTLLVGALCLQVVRLLARLLP